MDTKMIVQMQNIMGAYVQYVYMGRYDLCAEFFVKDECAEFNFPEKDVFIKDRECINTYFLDMKKSFDLKKSPREIYVLHTPAFRADEGFGTGTWEAFTFKYIDDESEEKNVEPSFWRFDCDFVYEKGISKIKRMDCYKLMNWENWKCKNLKSIANLPFAVQNYSRDINSEDFIQIERLISRFTHGNRSEVPYLFDHSEKAELYLSNLMDEKAVGYENILRFIQLLEEKEKQNNQLFAYIPYTTSPVIIVEDENHHAVGSWMVMSFDMDKSGDDSNYGTVTRRVGLLEAHFIKVNNEWKIEKYHYAANEVFEAVKLKANDSSSWRPPIEISKNKGRASDVFEIQSLMLEWTSRLKIGRLHECIDQYFSSNKEEITFWLGDNLEAICRGYDEIMKDMYRMDSTYQSNKYRTTIIHTAMTPLIEFSEDGTIAWGQWMDQCCTDLSQITGDYTLPLQAMVNCCKYQIIFRKENEHWKFLHFTWVAFAPMANIFANPNTWRGWVSRENGNWPMPFEKYDLCENR